MKNLVKEFKEFINRGNLVEIAVAFVMAVAFKGVVDVVTGTKDNPGIVGGIIGAVFGGDTPDFSSRGLSINGSFIPVGAFITQVINFVLVGIVAFLIVKAYNRLRRDNPPEPTDEVKLLTEIRDSLQARQ